MPNITVLAKRIKRKIRGCLMKPLNELKAKRVYEAIKNHKKDNEICILLNGLIGDSVYGLAYLDAIKEKNHDKKIIVYGHKKFDRLIESYHGIDEIRYVDGDSINQAEKDTWAIIGSNFFSEKGRREYIYNSNAFFYKACNNSPNPDILYQLRTYVYNVGDDVTITYHGIGNDLQAEYARKEITREHEKTVILNPYSFSTFEANIQVYTEIARVLKVHGFNIFTNVIADQKPIEGTKELRCSIYELYDVVKSSSLVISTRSGILDFLVSSDVDMFVIYENCSEKLKNMYHLTSWNRNGHIKELYPTNIVAETPQIIDNLKTFLNI